jgi:hypothetical protein
MNGSDSKATPHPQLTARFVHRVHEVRWRSLSPARAVFNSPSGERAESNIQAREFVIRVTPFNHDTCVLEASVEQDGRSVAVMTPHVVPMMCTLHDGVLHIDAFATGNGSAPRLAISVECASDGEPLRLLYAATPLLSSAGFAAGSYDRPRYSTPQSESMTSTAASNIRTTTEVVITAEPCRPIAAVASA